jgi:hypothetical protein
MQGMQGEFPAEPWRLRGDLYAGLWLVPAARMPHWPLPDGARPLSVAGRRMVVLFWADYRPEGVLAYREWLVALPVRHGRTVAATAVQAWVDSEPSRAGGRALWAVPKEPAEITFTPGGTSPRRGGVLTRLRATTRDPETGEADATGVYDRDVLRWPWRPAVRAHLLQRAADGTHRRVPLYLRGRPAWGRARLTADPRGPLGYLAGRAPVAALAVRDVTFVVGRSGRSSG